MTKISATLCAFAFALFTTPVFGQTPNPEPGIWTGTVVVKTTFVHLNHVRTSTFTVSGYVGSDAGGADSFYGVITNLDNLDKLDRLGSWRTTVSVPLVGVEENILVYTYIGTASFEVPVLSKSLRFTRNATTQKMRSIGFKLRKTDSFALGDDSVSEATIRLTWRKALPAIP